jgi:hypothetical protein
MAEPVSAHGRIAWTVQCPWEFRLCDAGRLPARAAAHSWLADFSVVRSAHDRSGRISGVDFQGCAALNQAWTDGCTRTIIVMMNSPTKTFATPRELGPKIGDGSLVIGVFLVRGIFALEILAPRQH